MGKRIRLPSRRSTEIFSFNHDRRRWTATISRFPDGAAAEIFLDTKPSPLADMAQDAAILASIALQHGAPLDVVRHAIAGREGPLAAALALVNGGGE